MNQRALLLLAALPWLGCGDEAAGQRASAAPAESASVGASEAEALAVQQSTFAREHADYSSYWHAGLAEISRFELRQTRYGQPRDGDLVMVFVTEPFLPDLQVKSEMGDPGMPVLKLNAMRSFETGIYPYQLMTSSFAPTDGTAALKVTSTVTEWCGQAFAQLNRREGEVHAQVRSYFQREGDADTRLEDAPYEDAIWQAIRRDPSALPQGALRMIPAMHALRLYHDDLQAYDVTAELEAQGERSTYSLRYASLGRTLEIVFESAFPHAIVEFRETHGGETTTAVRTHAIMDAYWGHNGNQHSPLRGALGLR